MATSSGKQTEAGKAFEYAFANTLYNHINKNQKVTLNQDSWFNGAKDAFETYDPEKQENYNKAAFSAVNFLVKLEPRLVFPISDEAIEISIQSDAKGKEGDVRDIVVRRPALQWEIGFSAKNNHTALKHSRLSNTIDFGNEWLGVHCSPQYIAKIRSIFEKVKKLVDDSKKNANHILLWNEVSEKDEIYDSVLNAFERELARLSQKAGIAEKLLIYFIGRNDFYKIIKSDKRRTTIQGFNINGTLNMPSGQIQPLNKIPKLKLPTSINTFDRKGSNTLIISFDNGWQVSLRIHNADAKAGSSLKFDIQLNGFPPSLYCHDEFWD